MWDNSYYSCYCWLHSSLNQFWHISSYLRTLSLIETGTILSTWTNPGDRLFDITDRGVTTLKLLTHWGRDKMATIFQTTFSNAFSWMKMYKFRLRFHWSLFPIVQLTIPALVPIMAWRRPGDKPLSEPMMASLLMHICVTWPQWVKTSYYISLDSLNNVVRTMKIYTNHKPPGKLGKKYVGDV